MLRDGKYAAWFRTSHGEGTGIVHLANGRISGGDSIFSYSGTYEVDGDRFTAVLVTRRHGAGPSTVFGIDEVEARLVGRFNGTTALCSGSAEQAPGVVFEATLFLDQEQLPQPDNTPVALNFDAGKLPKGAGRGFRARNPFARVSRI